MTFQPLFGVTFNMDLNSLKHKALVSWIKEIAELTKPKDIYICDGSDEEYQNLCNQLVQKGIFHPLNPQKRPNSFWCITHPDDVARVEERTFICCERSEDAGPTNQWKDPKEMKETLLNLFRGCMEGRTLYVIPYAMGHLGSKFCYFGIEITDSPYVVVNMKWMTHMGQEVLNELGTEKSFIPCLHSVGKPLKPGEQDDPWPCNPEQIHVVHFPEERSIWSFGSGYGGNALLGKKCLALRIASVLGRDEGWLAEHMLIIGVTNPEGEKKYFLGAFPSGCGKTNLAMLQSPLAGWKVETIGDDIAWVRVGEDGRLWAVNPEMGFFGIATGTSMKTNPSAMEMLKKNVIFTNTALTEDKDVWWEGMTDLLPHQLTDWKGNPWTSESKEPAANPNSRFTVSIKQCPALDPAFDDAKGVPISAILFGGRRTKAMPLIFETFSWEHGVFIGSSLSSEKTAAAKGKIGELRHDPFAMLPFCGYHMGDYFHHWLQLTQYTTDEKLPRIYNVNWFRKSRDGKYIWPGFGENIRVLKWIFERCSGTGKAIKTPLGFIPGVNLDISSLNLSPQKANQLFSLEIPLLLEDVRGLYDYFEKFGKKLPSALKRQLDDLHNRLHQELENAYIATTG